MENRSEKEADNWENDQVHSENEIPWENYQVQPSSSQEESIYEEFQPGAESQQSENGAPQTSGAFRCILVTYNDENEDSSSHSDETGVCLWKRLPQQEESPTAAPPSKRRLLYNEHQPSSSNKCFIDGIGFQNAGETIVVSDDHDNSISDDSVGYNDYTDDRGLIKIPSPPIPEFLMYDAGVYGYIHNTINEAILEYCAGVGEPQACSSSSEIAGPSNAFAQPQSDVEAEQDDPYDSDAKETDECIYISD